MRNKRADWPAKENLLSLEYGRGRAFLADTLQLDSRVEDFSQDEHGVTAILKPGERVTGDVLIGADGIHSATRLRLVGDGPTDFSGKLVWRVLIPADRIADFDCKERFYGWAGLDRMVFIIRPLRAFNKTGSPSVQKIWVERAMVWTLVADVDPGVTPRGSGR